MKWRQPLGRRRSKGSADLIYAHASKCNDLGTGIYITAYGGRAFRCPKYQGRLRYD